MDRFRLIAEIRKRPALWDFQCVERSRQKIADLWKEIAICVGEDVTVEACKCKWKHLRDAYRTEMRRAQHRMERDIRKGKYDPNKNYGSKWCYFEHMNFLDIGSRPGLKHNDSHLNINDNPELEFETEHLSSKFPDVQHKEWHQNQLGPPPLKSFNALKRNFLLNNCDNPPVYYNKNPKSAHPLVSYFEDSDIDEEMFMEPSTSSQRHVSDYKSATNNEESGRQYNTQDTVTVKLESDIEIDSATTYHLETEEENSNEMDNSFKPPEFKRIRLMDRNSVNKTKTSTSLVVPPRRSPECSNTQTSSEKAQENIATPQIETTVSTRNPSQISDPDSNFLISFCSHMKTMNQLQNLQFRLKMSELILEILTTSSSTNSPPGNLNNFETIDNQDPDAHFLISFWPHLKTLTQLQNLQFRAKMSDLILSILANSLNAVNTSDSTTTEGN